MQLFDQTVPFWKAVTALAIAALAQGFYSLYKARSKFWALQREHGIATIPHSFLFGHLLVIGKILAEEAPEAHQQLSFWLLLEKKYPHLWKQGFFYLDLWPVQYPMLTCYDPELISQFAQQNSQPKSVVLTQQIRKLTGGQDLLSAEGHHWRSWRSNFNPGFSARNITSLVPAFIEEILVFRQALADAADSGKVVKLSDQASRLAFDVIGNAVLGVRIHALSKEDSFYSTFVKRISWNFADWSLNNLSKVINPMRPFITRYLDRQVNDAIISYIDRNLKDEHQSDGPKTVLHLAIKAYFKQMPEGDGAVKSVSDFSPAFITDVLAHLKLFLLAGFDTTSYTLCVIFWKLQQNPDCLAKVRAEHDEVFGDDPALSAQKIRDDPTLLNQLPYTTAVMKESMRVQAVTGSVRAGEPGFVLTNPATHRPMPTEGFVLYSSAHALHHNPMLWPRRLEFLPERWLVPEGHELHPVKNAWRPFEIGPRNCIGQELAQTELRAVLVLTLRDFDLLPQYDVNGPKVLGDLAYQVPAEVTTRPKDGLPVKIIRRGDISDQVGKSMG